MSLLRNDARWENQNMMILLCRPRFQRHRQSVPVRWTGFPAKMTGNQSLPRIHGELGTMTAMQRWAVVLSVLSGTFVGGGVVGARGELPNRPPEAPAPLADATRRMSVPKGFHVSLFAGEPDVVQPIAFTIDPRGRLWVAENMTYPGWRQKPSAPDRIIILEDTDGDGRFDRRKVFWDQGQTVSGLALGFGGV